MKQIPFLLGALAGAVTTGLATALVAFIAHATRVDASGRKRAQILASLPQDLATWRTPGDTTEAQHRIWNLLDPLLQEQGLIPWTVRFSVNMGTPDDSWASANGYQYALPVRDIESMVAGSVYRMKQFDVTNPLKRVARTMEGQDVVLRVIALNDEGHDHLKIMRELATSPASLLTNNHTLPMLREIHIGNIIIGVFPKACKYNLHTIMHTHIWARNSVGDNLEMIMQALEALAFLHERKIAHRDAFLDNFLVQWHPESMRTGTISPCRPRVYLIDFEMAHAFDPELPREKCMLTGIPCGGSVNEVDEYSRQTIPEMLTGVPYDAFKVDVWQLATALTGLQTTISEVDALLEEMRSADPEARLDACVALTRLQNIVYAIPPQELHIAPVIPDSEYLPI